jgi:dehydrogenase E1 component
VLWRLPLLIVLEDNGWSQSTPTSMNLAGDIGARFTAFGLLVVEVDTTDVLEIDAAADEAVTQCRSGDGPAALVVHTYRFCHHSKNDDNRPIEEVQARLAYDPLAVHGVRLASTSAGPSSSKSRQRSRTARRRHDSCDLRAGLGRRAASGAGVGPRGGPARRDIVDPYGGAFKVNRGLSTHFPTRVLATPVNEAAIAEVSAGLAMSGYRPNAEIMFGDF